MASFGVFSMDSEREGRLGSVACALSVRDVDRLIVDVLRVAIIVGNCELIVI